MYSLIQKINNGVLVIGAILHELFHALMAILLYPFGSRLEGVKIVAGFDADGDLVFEGRVYTSNERRISKFLVAAAPGLFFIVITTLLCIYTICWPFCGWFVTSMLPSKHDLTLIKESLGIIEEKSGTITSAELNKILNGAMDKNVIGKDTLTKND